MKVKFVYHPENDTYPHKLIGESIVYELSFPSSPDVPSANFMLRCHKCGLVASLVDHTVKIVDGKVTISPSCDCPNSECDAHYWIKDGQVV